MNPFAILAALAVPFALLCMFLARGAAAPLQRLRGERAAVKAAALVGLIAAVAIGGSKPGGTFPAEAIFEFLVRRGAELQPAGIPAHGDAEAAIALASAAVEDAGWAQGAAAEALARALLAASAPRAWLSLDLAPVDGGNVRVDIARIEQGDETVDVLCRLPIAAAEAVPMTLQCSTSEGEWVALERVGEGEPESELVDGVEHVRATYALPPEARGLPLRAPASLEFGGFDGELFELPPEGARVDGAEGFTGVDEFEGGLRIEYSGGIAVGVEELGTGD